MSDAEIDNDLIDRLSDTGQSADGWMTAGEILAAQGRPDTQAHRDSLRKRLRREVVAGRIEFGQARRPALGRPRGTMVIAYRVVRG